MAEAVGRRRPAAPGLADAYPPIPGGGTLAILLRLFALNIKARLEYRADFVMNVLHGITYQLVGIAFIWTVLHRFPSLGGWNFGEVAFLYALRLLGHSLYLPFFWNLMALSELVRSGDFDRLLLRPVHPLILVITRAFQMNAAGDLVMSLAVFWVAQSALHLTWSATDLLYLLLVLAGAVLIEAAVQLILSSLAIWVVDASPLNWWADDLFNTFGNYPLTIYDRSLRFGFTYILPLAFVGYFPATVFLDRTGGGVFQVMFAYATPVVGVLSFVVALLFFSFSLRHYRSTGT